MNNMTEPADLRQAIEDHMRAAPVVGQSYYILCSRWYKKFLNTCEPFHGVDSIDNSDLIESTDNDTGDIWLKTNMYESDDYLILPEAAWALLYERFGGGPAIKRVALEQAYYNSGRVEVHPLTLHVHASSEPSHVVRMLVSKSTTIGEFKALACARLGKGAEDVRVIDFYNGQRYANLHNLGKSLDESKVQNNQAMQLEEKLADGTFPIEKASTGSSSGYSDGTEVEGGAGVRGVTGLVNLGNTCFMNSALQCLSNSPGFCEYFTSEAYKGEINRENPIGLKGELAEQFGSLITTLWCGRWRSYAPRDFKYALSKFAPQFSGYQQHDSQEVVTFLLDGLHEDLNRILTKPAVPAVEGAGRPDAEVADEAWTNHRARNDSKVVDTFQGQFKSTVCCDNPTCGNVSVTFDPFMYLSLPLGDQDRSRTVRVNVVRVGGLGVTNHAVKVLKFGSIADLKEALSKDCGVPAGRMVIGEVWNHEIYRFYKPTEEIDLISTKDIIAAWEVDAEDVEVYEAHDVRGYGRSSVPSCGRLRMIFNQKRTGQRSYSSESEWKLFGIPLLLSVDAATVASVEALYKATRQRFGLDCEDFRLVFKVNSTYQEEELDASSTDELPNFAAVGEKLSMHCYDEPSTPTPMDSEKAEEPTGAPTKTVTLDDCIAAFLSEEKLSEQETWYCSKCKEHRQAIKKFDFWRMPEILVVQLKRFDYTKYSRDKREDLVSFPITGLDLGVHLKVPGAPGAQGTVYDLYAVSNHFGGMGGGHYTAYAKNPVNKHWYNFNDSFVERVDDESQIQTAAAYMLFYQRRAT